MGKFFCADLHIGHKRLVQHDERLGRIPRPFGSIEDHDNEIIRSINETCDSGDTLYVLGDVTVNSKNLYRLREINCKMHLIMGNHDLEDSQTYMKYFYKVSAYRVFEKFIATHIPIHPMEMPRFNVNVHGHLHNSVVRCGDGNIDAHYICVSMEQIGYKPISFEAIEQRIMTTVRGRVKGDTTSHP